MTPETEPKPIRDADLARHWGVSRSYVCGLRRHKAMPDFVALATADEWRAVHAPPKPANSGRRAPLFAGEHDDAAKNPVGSPRKKNRGFTDTNTSPETEEPPEKIDIDAFISTGGVDFDGLVIQQAEQATQIAYGLLKRASGRGDPNAISAATRNWQESARASAEVRERYLKIQERNGELISLDRVMDVVGTQLNAVRSALDRLGERIAAAANPADPAVAKAAIDAAVDTLFRQLETAAARTRTEVEAIASEHADGTAPRAPAAAPSP